ncbi:MULTISPECIES: TIGR03960 family B12-binding radical SAM protein [unclassified Thermotoga]|uniref:TIGR03960 family B12-binding radical SAM protein n=1 Tax=unclassified Thermotoga TaxID=2631113 RepID=UPI000543EC48|nr:MULTISPECIES: TIGR03960 family B12-binding radical SAM protein [unclassified Thermotoga]KHC92454.1 radical SAM domain-containing protein [Thermotoga sp. TBGT1765]KHC93846.1 radical SAM domain-containing protein [Thermotoga sp. TBGT1766]KHC96532.1 radical SAM domain-containing protein [Thermotoga sp. Xyl54]
MILKFLNETLPWVRKPSRYIGREINSVVKDPEEVSLRIALVFPDTYEVGTSNHGLEILYHILNEQPDVWAERSYLPWIDMIERMKEKDIPLYTMESYTPLYQMDAVGISLEYELSYTNVIEVLKLSRIPLFFWERKRKDPIVLGGGPCSSNPEPIYGFFDAILIGDGEEAILEIAQVLKETKGEERETIWKELSKIEGVYVPAFYEQKGKKIVPVSPEYPQTIKRRVVKDLNSQPVPVKKIVPNVESVHDRAIIEVARGCTRGCRFCHASVYYRPVRERSLENILENVEEMLKNTGYEEVSLLSLSTMDHTQIGEIVSELLKRYSEKKIAVSIPSTRMDRFGVEIAGRIASVRKTGLTFAPEASTQRLRNIINKNISEEDIFATLEAAKKSGWRRVKLYFMMGLPGETNEDLEEMVELLEKVKRLGFKEVSASVSVFVPKPHTPFQFARQISPEEAHERIRTLKRAKKFAEISYHDPRMSLLEGVFSRGDRKLLNLIVKAHELGALFDEWSEMFRFDLWEKAFDETGIDPKDYLREIDPSEDLPWDHIDMGVTKEFLKEEYRKAIKGETTDDCRWNRCYLCGVCFRFGVKNVLFGGERG